MINNRLICRAARYLRRGGFTLVELLVVIGIIAILAGVALGPITRGIKQAQENATLQVSHQIGVLEFAYSNDYNQVYPYPTTGVYSNSVADALLNGGYTSTPSLFYVANTPSASKYTGATTPYNLNAVKGVCNWDFMYNATGTSGLTSSSSDATPLVELTGGTPSSSITTTYAAGAATLTINTTKTAFGADGIAVYYKGNNAKFLKGAQGTGSTATVSNWIDTTFVDPSGASYGLATAY